jgi:hypothetical protein
MKTLQLDKIVSNTLKYLLHFLGVACFFGILLYSMFSFWLPFLILNFSKVYYTTASKFSTELVALLGIYSLFCYFANNFILNLYEKGRTLQVIVSYLVDLLIVPLSVLILIIYYNKAEKIASGYVSMLYNVYLITGLLIVKVIIAARILSKGSAKRKA